VFAVDHELHCKSCFFTVKSLCNDVCSDWSDLKMGFYHTPVADSLWKIMDYYPTWSKEYQGLLYYVSYLCLKMNVNFTSVSAYSERGKKDACQRFAKNLARRLHIPYTLKVQKGGEKLIFFDFFTKKAMNEESLRSLQKYGVGLIAAAEPCAEYGLSPLDELRLHGHGEQLVQPPADSHPHQRLKFLHEYRL
jgi:hypothetical protein